MTEQIHLAIQRGAESFGYTDRRHVLGSDQADDAVARKNFASVPQRRLRSLRGVSSSPERSRQTVADLETRPSLGFPAADASHERASVAFFDGPEPEAA